METQTNLKWLRGPHVDTRRRRGLDPEGVSSAAHGRCGKDFLCEGGLSTDGYRRNYWFYHFKNPTWAKELAKTDF